MCGRFTQKTDAEKISKKFDVPKRSMPPLRPRYNIAPSQPIATVVQRTERHIDFMNWGLIPSWAKDPSIGSRMINARAETLIEKPSYRGPLKHHRCLIIADGFYEWKDTGYGKQPFYFHLPEMEVFAFAGLFDEWSHHDGSFIRSCTIITREATEPVSTVHHRMPVILNERVYDEWLDPYNYNPVRLMGLLEDQCNENLKSFSVSSLMNNPDNDTEQCIEPVYE